jgi:hypothetical protein
MSMRDDIEEREKKPPSLPLLISMMRQNVVYKGRKKIDSEIFTCTFLFPFTGIVSFLP